MCSLPLLSNSGWLHFFVPFYFFYLMYPDDHLMVYIKILLIPLQSYTYAIGWMYYIFSNLSPTNGYLDCFQSFTIEKSLCFLVLLILLSIVWQVHLWHRFLEEDYWFRVNVYIILQHNSQTTPNFTGIVPFSISVSI